LQVESVSLGEFWKHTAVAKFPILLTHMGQKYAMK